MSAPGHVALEDNLEITIESPICDAYDPTNTAALEKANHDLQLEFTPLQDHVTSFMITTVQGGPALTRVKAKARNCEINLNLPRGSVQILQQERHPTDGRRGCFESHWNLYEKWLKDVEEEAKNKGANETPRDWLLVFEDDVEWLLKVDPVAYVPFLERNNDWDIFYFGHRARVDLPDLYVRRTQWHNITHVKTNDTHAYIVNRHFVERFLRDAPHYDVKAQGIDVTLRQSTEQAYAIFPMVAIQDDENGQKEVMNEFIQYHGFKHFSRTMFKLYDTYIYIGLKVFAVVLLLIIIISISASV